MHDEFLISGARNSAQLLKDTANSDLNIPNIADKRFSLPNFEKFVLQSEQTFSELGPYIQQGRLGELMIRFNLWRMLLGVLKVTSSVEEKLLELARQRENYENLVKKYVKGTAEPSQKRDPLSRDSGNNLWNNHFENTELKNEIKKDVDRTYQDKQFFQNLKVKSLLTNILFIWCKVNNDISYKQGINELAASIIYVYFQEVQGSKEIESLSNTDIVRQFNNVKYCESDIYAVFEKLMNDLQHMEMFRPNYTEKQKMQNQSKKASAILAKCAKIQDIHLKVVDLELFKHLKMLNVEFQIFLLRWIRCLFTREFHLEDSLSLWDAIFYDYHESQDSLLIDCIALAMISYVRDQILEKDDGSMCLQRFLKYPPIENLKSVLDTAHKYKTMLLNPSLQLQEEKVEEQSAFFTQLSKVNQVSPLLKKDDFTSRQDKNVPEVQKKDIQVKVNREQFAKRETIALPLDNVECAIKTIRSIIDGLKSQQDISQINKLMKNQKSDRFIDNLQQLEIIEGKLVEDVQKQQFFILQ